MWAGSKVEQKGYRRSKVGDGTDTGIANEHKSKKINNEYSEKLMFESRG